GETTAISSEQLRDRVVTLLERDYGDKVAARYQQQTLVVTPIRVRHPDGHVFRISCSIEHVEFVYEEPS
ncbi:MAG: hypothetical protein ACWGPN_03345, partial [Gammaproteobacteria bacterium]